MASQPPRKRGSVANWMMNAPIIRVPVITAAMIKLRVFTDPLSRSTRNSPDVESVLRPLIVESTRNEGERRVLSDLSHGELEESG